MTVQDNKQLVHDFYAALVREDYDAAAAMCHEKFVFYNQIDTPRPGAAGFVAAEKKHLDAFKGFSMGVETIGEGDKVAAYVIFEGDQCKEFYGVEPRGAHLRMSMLNLFTIEDGLISEKRAHYDRYDHIEQLQSGVA
ncbi:putative ester cyclase [Nocardioides aromaticivorans]|uniref:Putative ester cyclase n=1 Tax=Nocardioides aromaticivorans TaxID=200618 RepID=A0A7Y9ZJD7_9ACTN|nr:ester cyclase [Nocardioides aromaticivorans]NYI45025.1 putative ester cyclase [Nocardioides aromaticivorans]